MAPASEVNEGVWGKPTSTLDWCEENYVVTPYIAELWNTVSSGIIIVLPILTMISFLYCNVEVERRFYLSCLGFMTVGLGSWFFHMTLIYEAQLLDELPMIWGTCVLVYLFYENNSKPKSHNYPLVVFLVIYAVSVTCIYVLSKDPVLHQIAYALLVISIMFRGVYCFCINKQDYSAMLLILSVALYAFGFCLWLIDNVFCAQLRYMRSFIPAQAHALLQLHAYWHVFASHGTHCQIMFSFHARCRFLKHNAQIWNLGCLPLVAVDVKENGHLD